MARRIIMAVTNDLLTDQRVDRSCRALQESGYAVTLIGRRLGHASGFGHTSNEVAEKALDARPYRCVRMRLLFRRSALFYAEYNMRLLLKLLLMRADAFYANDSDTIRTMCLADMVNTIADPNHWDYDILIPSDANEIMTDVTATSTHIVIASVFKNDRRIVAFRQKSINMGIFRAFPWEALYRYKYDISDYIEECFPYGFMRIEKTPVLLSPSSNGFVAGLSADYIEPRGPKLNRAVLLFDMEDASIMNEYQAVRAGVEPRLKELTYLPTRSSIAILYNFKSSVLDDSAYSVLQFPVLGKVSECEVYYDTLMRKDGGMIQSIIPLDGIQRQYDRSNSCFALYGENSIERRPVLEYEREAKELLHKYYGEEAICVFSSTVPTVENVTIICSH